MRDKEKQRAYFALWKARNREKIRRKDRLWYAANRLKTIERNRRWQASNSDSVKQRKRRWRDSLSDGYVRSVLSQRTGLNAPKFPPEVVEFKRQQLRLKRLLRGEVI